MHQCRIGCLLEKCEGRLLASIGDEIYGLINQRVSYDPGLTWPTMVINVGSCGGYTTSFEDRI